MTPRPLISLALAPRNSTDDERMARGLEALLTEDPTLSAHADTENGYIVLGGQGELHLEVAVDRLRREFGVEADVSRPEITFKEALSRPADSEMKYEKHHSGRNHVAHVRLHVEPTESGTGLTFVNAAAGTLPDRFVAIIEESVREQAARGAIAGHPIDDVTVTLTGGAHHEQDSSEMAFSIAASVAFLDAARRAGPVLLQPVMQVEITTPAEYGEAVTADITGRGGRVTGLSERGGAFVMTARVPLAGLSGYANDLRAISRGKAAYTTAFAAFEPVRRGPAAGAGPASVN
jgi:elongation factor G